MSVDTTDNYIQSMTPHLDGTVPATVEEYETSEKLLNAHMRSWSRIFNYNERVASNFQAKNNEIPPLYGTRKDHKYVPPEDVNKGPPQRPVCGAVVASNYRLSHFISSIIQPIINDAAEPCTSTEDLLSRIDQLNERENLDNCIIGSMDVSALYPSIDIEFSVDKCVEMIYESNVKFENVNIDELGLHLSLSTDEQILMEQGLNRFCPTRKKKGKRPTITASGSESNAEKRWQCWNKREIKPSPEDERKMICYALGITMKTTLQNHIFIYNDQIRKQENGGAIGVKAAGDIAGLFMVWWDREFKSKVEEEGINIKLYARYVDDETIISDTIPEDETNKDQEADERTMKTLQEIANAIHPSIQLTVDYPSNNENGRIPILDTEQWLETVEVHGEMRVQVLHSHYTKPMANKSVILRESAFPIKSKMNVLVADLVRIMRNISRKCKTEERLTKIQVFMNRMQFSGYSKKERYEVYTRAKRRYEKMVRNNDENIRPLYRNKEWKKDERIKEKREKQRNWYRKDGSEAVFFVSATPNEELANMCQDVFKSQGVKVKVVEKITKTVKKSLTKSNPFKEIGCDKPSCDVCKTDTKTNCKARDVVYKISCHGTNEQGEPCDNIEYIGETSRSVGERFNEHMETIKSQQEKTRKKSFLYEHVEEQHKGEIPPVKVEVLYQCFSNASLRQALEAVLIREENPILNRKEEWNNEPRKRKTQTKPKTGNVTSGVLVTSEQNDDVAVTLY